MIRILVDSASDISYKNTDGVMVVPLSVTLNGQTYLDGVELSHDEFYTKLIGSEDFPKSSQPAPQLFVEAFEEVKANHDEVICILLSSGVSGTYQSALLAKNIVDYDKIHIVDSLTGAYGVQLLVLEALKRIEQGCTCEDIVAYLEDLKKRVQIYLSVDTLEYLYRGGRLDKKSAVIGGIAKIKPVIEVTREGTIGVTSKTIGMIRAMNEITRLVKESGVDQEHPVYTIYTYGEKNVEKLENKLADSGIVCSERVQLGPVVGTHVGPEAFGIIYIRKM